MTCFMVSMAKCRIEASGAPSDMSRGEVNIVGKIVFI